MILISILSASILSIAQGQEFSQISCQICEETIDHVGDFLSGNPGCYNMTEDFFQPCPSGNNLCGTKMAVDWFSGGNQEITFSRYCSKKNVEFGQECLEGGNTAKGQNFLGHKSYICWTWAVRAVDCTGQLSL